MVLRPVEPWSASTNDILKQLHDTGFENSPRLVGDGFSSDGRQALRFIPGEVVHPRVGPWSILARDDRPIAVIDWEFAGPVDPMVELAQADYARQLRLLVDGYDLPREHGPDAAVGDDLAHRQRGVDAPTPTNSHHRPALKGCQYWSAHSSIDGWTPPN